MMRRLLIFQVILVVLLTLTLALLQSYLAAKSGLFGGMIALMNTGLMLLHDKRAQRSDDAKRVIRYVYLCAAERMLLTIILFAVGLVALKLMPLPLLLGFIAAQLAAFINGLSR